MSRGAPTIRKRTLLGAACLVGFFCLPVLAGAQETAKAELFGGYSYLRLDPGESFRHTDLNGWQAAITYNLTDRVGVVAEFAGHYGSVGAPPNALGVAKLDIDQHTFLFGLSVKAVRSDRASLSLRALLGPAVGRTDAPSVGGTPIDADATVLASVLGAAIDIKLSKRVAFRILEPSLLLTRYNGHTQESVRVAAGFVFYLGEL